MYYLCVHSFITKEDVKTLRVSDLRTYEQSESWKQLLFPKNCHERYPWSKFCRYRFEKLKPKHHFLHFPTISLEYMSGCMLGKPQKSSSTNGQDIEAIHPLNSTLMAIGTFFSLQKVLSSLMARPYPPIVEELFFLLPLITQKIRFYIL